jgi:hypothetical protein
MTEGTHLSERKVVTDGATHKVLIDLTALELTYTFGPTIMKRSSRFNGRVKESTGKFFMPIGQKPNCPILQG